MISSHDKALVESTHIKECFVLQRKIELLRDANSSIQSSSISLVSSLSANLEESVKAVAK